MNVTRLCSRKPALVNACLLMTVGGDTHRLPLLIMLPSVGQLWSVIGVAVGT